MTVVVCTAASEGIVVATDSRRMQSRGGSEPTYEVASDLARKLFVVDRIVVATRGEAMIGDETIGQIMDRFDAPVDSGPRAYAEALGVYFAHKLSEATLPQRGDLFKAENMKWPIGFAVAGYEDGIGYAFWVRVRRGDSNVEQLGLSTDNPGVLPFGQADAINRLLNGIDEQALRDVRIAIPAEDQPKLPLLSYDLVLPQNVEEAAELAEFLITTQLGAQRFSYGAHASGRRIPGCGGPIRIASVSVEGASWIAGRPPEQELRRQVA